jgi:hypothetical protein
LVHGQCAVDSGADQVGFLIQLTLIYLRNAPGISVGVLEYLVDGTQVIGVFEHIRAEHQYHDCAARVIPGLSRYALYSAQSTCMLESGPGRNLQVMDMFELKHGHEVFGRLRSVEKGGIRLRIQPVDTTD